jgi:phosphoglycolate phosphatase
LAGRIGDAGGQPGITLVCFGLVGTLIADDGTIERAFAEAIATQGVVSGTSDFARCMAQVHRGRGRTPADILASLFPDNVARAQAAQLAYDRSLASGLARGEARPVQRATAVLGELAEAGYRLCVTTMLPRRQATAMVRSAGWRDLITATLTADDVPRGCPSPDLALAAMLRVGVGDVREIAMVHATGAGVECGRRAGASVVIGVTSGPHPAPRLRAAGATHILDGVAGVPQILADVAAAGLPDPSPGLAGLTAPVRLPSQAS